MFSRMILLALLLCPPFLSTGISASDPPPRHAALLIGTMNFVRQDHTATLLANGKVLLVGWDSKTAELFDPSTGLFSTTGVTIANHKQGSTATLLNSGKVLIAGGVNALRVAELYDPDTGFFNLTDSLATVHSYHTATLLPDGRVLIAGGQNHTGPQTHAVAEIYDPTSGTFTLTDSLRAHRSGHIAAPLPNGKVLIAGGIQTTTPGSGMYLSLCEEFDPSTRSFSMVPAMQTPRAAHTGTILGNGKVLIGGGGWNSNVCELYDYTTQTWTQTDTMSVIRRMYHEATLLSDGRVLFTGGSTGSEMTATVDVYDPATNSFSSRDTMTTRRMSHTATRLLNGDVLITGGYGGTTALKSAEIINGSVPTDVRRARGERAQPTSTALEQNFPNPFNPCSDIRFQISESGMTRLAVYDLLGREITVLVNEKKTPGNYEVRFDASGLASGVYMYRLITGAFVHARTMVILK